jgi:hypothetical protein
MGGEVTGMLLQRVVYELFDWEAEGFASRLPSGYDELRRQVRLDGADGTRVYISWAWGQGQPDYFLAYGSDSFFTALPQAELDVSGSSGRQSLVGQEIEVRYRDDSWQVIEVRSNRLVVYCGSFQCDRVFVMLKLRRPSF